jgi:hypothetical protein
VRDDDPRTARKLRQDDRYKNLSRDEVINLYRQKRQTLLTMSPGISSDEFDEAVRGVRAVAFWSVGQVLTWLDDKITSGEGVGK